MNPLHELLDAFADGELDVADAERFRLHLASCPQCQARLAEGLQLRALEWSLRTATSAPQLRASRGLGAWLPLRRIAPLGVMLAAAAMVAFFLWPRREPADLFVGVGARPLEARLAWAGAKSYRPYEVLRSSERRPSVPVPLKTMAVLEERGDLHGLGVAHLLRGELDEAAELLGRGPSEPDRISDRAAVALERGRPEEALALVDEALEKRPQHPQALWNRGLALEALSLDASAAAAFSSVGELAEPGWAQEASQRAQALQRDAEGGPRRWLEAWQAGIALALDGKPMPPEVVRAAPSMARNYLYQAVWAAPSAERVRALLPLAKVLDEGTPASRLSTYVAEIATHDFRRRGPLAERFAKVLTGYLERLRAQGTALEVPPGHVAFDVAQTEGYLKAIIGSGEDDLLLGVLPLLGLLSSHLDVYAKAAEARGDPFFTANVLLEKARQDEASGLFAEAESRLLAALQQCGAEADYRRLQAELRLAQLYRLEHRVGEMREHALAGLRLARAQHEPHLELTLLHTLADHARYTNSVAVARAYLAEEGRRKPGDRELGALLHEERAMLQLLSTDPKKARDELDAVEGPLSIVGAMALADVAKLDARPEDLERVRAALKLLRGAPHSPGRELLFAHIEAKTQLASDRPGGMKALRQVVSDAQGAALEDPDGQKARSYSYSALLLAAGEEQRFADALALFAEEARGAMPPRCVLGVELNDSQLLVAVRGADGVAAGEYRSRMPGGGVATASLVPRSVRERLGSCERVEVFARNGLHGQADLLPPELAWSFRTGPPHTVRPPAEPRQLIVSDIEPPPSLRLPPLRSWRGPPLPGSVALRGAEATPRRVLGELGTATEVQFHSHGLVNLGTSDASLLVLSQDAEGDFALTAQQVRATRLKGAPVVVLAACRSSRSPLPSLAAPWSLPVAFLEAGARAVLASASDIPDAEAGSFFEAVLGRIRGGQPPSEALRDERAPRLVADPKSWVGSVVVFEAMEGNLEGGKQ